MHDTDDSATYRHRNQEQVRVSCAYVFIWLHARWCGESGGMLCSGRIRLSSQVKAIDAKCQTIPWVRTWAARQADPWQCHVVEHLVSTFVEPASHICCPGPLLTIKHRTFWQSVKHSSPLGPPTRGPLSGRCCAQKWLHSLPKMYSCPWATSYNASSTNNYRRCYLDQTVCHCSCLCGAGGSPVV